MRGCLLPSGNAAEFPKLDAELRRRGINPLVRYHDGGARTYLILDEQVRLLPVDEQGPYLGDDNSGHSIYPIDDDIALYQSLFIVTRCPPDLSKREARFPFGDGSTMIVRGMYEKDECFTNERQGSFNVTEARLWANANLPITSVIIDVLDTLQHLQKNIDLDEERLLQIAERGFEEVLRETVLLYVMMPHGQHMLIDGHHRLAFLAMVRGRAHQKQLRANARLMTHEMAQHFQVTYVEQSADGRERSVTADELLIRISGIYSSPDGDIRTNPRKRNGGRS